MLEKVPLFSDQGTLLKSEIPIPRATLKQINLHEEYTPNPFFK